MNGSKCWEWRKIAGGWKKQIKHPGDRERRRRKLLYAENSQERNSWLKKSLQGIYSEQRCKELKTGSSKGRLKGSNLDHTGLLIKENEVEYGEESIAQPRSLLHHQRFSSLFSKWPQLSKGEFCKLEAPCVSECAYSVGSIMSDSSTPQTLSRQAPLSMGFSRQEYWGGLPCPPPGHLPDPGIQPVSFLLLHGRRILCHLSCWIHSMSLSTLS